MAVRRVGQRRGLVDQVGGVVGEHSFPQVAGGGFGAGVIGAVAALQRAAYLPSLETREVFIHRGLRGPCVGGS
ncbi:hypothetical protein [Micromonospora sp. NPDC003776]